MINPVVIGFLIKSIIIIGGGIAACYALSEPLYNPTATPSDKKKGGGFLNPDFDYNTSDFDFGLRGED